MSPSLKHGRRAAVTLLLSVLLSGAALAVAPVALAADDPSGACTDPDGVTVVVDLTELGGEVEVGCAPAAATGAEALTAAGFADTRDGAGMVCAIEAAPDPCPTEFTGTYWSYWTAEPDGEWTMYMEGPDTAVPAPGSFEGWRYGDGSAGPTVAVADLAGGGDEPAEPTARPTEVTSEDVTADGTTSDAAFAVSEGDDAEGTPAWLVAVVGVGALGAGAAIVVGLARRRRDVSGPPGQD